MPAAETCGDGGKEREDEPEHEERRERDAAVDKASKPVKAISVRRDCRLREKVHRLL